MTHIFARFQNLPRTIMTGALGVSLLVGLAACGDAAATATPPAPAAAVATATPAAGSMDMTNTPAGQADATPAATAAGGSAATDAVEVKATLREWALDLSQTEVAAGKVRFVVTNEGMMQHNFTIKNDSGDLAQTKLFSSSQGAQTVEVTLAPGTYTVYCSLPGHADRGQKNTLVVK
jgi:plastocyanin